MNPRVLRGFGLIEAQETPGNLAPELDFDGDGKRDLALWLAPSGSATRRLTVMLSGNSPAFAAPHLQLDVGQAGDIPVPARYDADLRTDIAFYRAGTFGGGAGTGSIIWNPRKGADHIRSPA